MKQLLVTACAVAALCGTALAQSPASKDGTPPAAKDSTAPAATSGTTVQPAKPAGSTATNSKDSTPIKPGASAATNQAPAPTASQSADKARAPAGIAAVQPQGALRVTFYSVKPADVRASTLIGTTVHNANNESVGEIEDVVLEDGKSLSAVVIGVGGFLGMGEHNVAVEPHALMITRNPDNDAIKIVINTTKEDLKNAPAVKFDKESRSSAASADPKTLSTTGAGDRIAPSKDSGAAKAK